jgi:hypothetical protein
MKRLSLVFVLTLACSGEEASKPSSKEPAKQVEPSKAVESATPPEPKPAEPLAPKDGFFMAEGAPEPRACEAAADCVSNTIPDVENPCCQDPRTLEPYAKAYWYWVGEWRKDNCASVSCPPPPPPARPPECASKLDCVDGLCVDACP